MRYIVVQREGDGSIGFAKSFSSRSAALACANDRLTRLNINAIFVLDDFKFVDWSGSVTARNNEETIKVTILKEDEYYPLPQTC